MAAILVAGIEETAMSVVFMDFLRIPLTKNRQLGSVSKTGD